MAVIVSKGIVVPYYGPPVGTTWLYEDNGTFIVPADGIYQVEMHGGGGGGGFGGVTYDSTWAATVYQGGGGGGGSGEIITTSLIKNTSYEIKIGGGGTGATNSTAETAATDGGTTSFGDYSIGGGKAGITSTRTNTSGGSASGSLATSGKNGEYQMYIAIGGAGGYGNKNNTTQTYGNGGKGGEGGSGTVEQWGASGNPGAVIITFMGVA